MYTTVVEPCIGKIPPASYFYYSLVVDFRNPNVGIVFLQMLALPAGSCTRGRDEQRIWHDIRRHVAVVVAVAETAFPLRCVISAVCLSLSSSTN